ncbi:putative bifunctional diguanylate cyclase/phosphodiesterase [Paucisalibacillus globulus]|uniref:putative bifunctional diguanylate cyclase/phosphodiesterase n=1 Tax=Paucisalibacillus globulus TaxID=351095 RepID=UPI000BB7E239|nr:EAL domain-containing protein [Paucisalibacillus globulus]
MNKQKRNAILFIILYLAAFYGWLWFYADHTWMRIFGASLFPIIGGAVSIYWLFRPIRILSTDHRIFIILLSTGIFLPLLSNLLWLFNLLVNGETGYPDLSFVLWLAGYVFLLLTLIYKLKLLYHSLSMGPFLFNILIFMIAAISISYHYLINPIIELSNEHETLVAVYISYPILDIGIAFLAINIFYMTRYTKEYKAFLYLSLGFLVQIITDTIYIHSLINHQYENGSMIDPLWTLAILLLGYTNFQVEIFSEDIKWISNSYPKHSDNGLLLNLSVIFLAFLVMQSTGWNWNALVLGLVLSIIFIVIRQILMIKQQRELVHDLWYHAYHDKLTGLLNRASYQQDIKNLINFANENQKKFAIMLLDFDRFKNINDTLGHGIGDQLLQECSIRLKESIPINGRVYRVGGDEFIIILQDATENYCKHIAEMILDTFSKALTVSIYQISITPSIGISLYPENGSTSETLLKNADTSMYLAKSKGRNQYEVFSPELNNQMARKMQIENDLSLAITNNELLLHYQPKVHLQSRKIIGTEALLRWKHSTLGVLAPDEFIPLAEETGEIVSIGNWVLYNACKQLKQWQEYGHDDLLMCINVSVRQFQHKDFLNNVKKIIEQTGVNPASIEFEITESIMQNIVDTTRILNELRKMGVQSAIDDFGTGYSSLSVLKDLPIFAIKIDRSFIIDLTEKDIAMVKTIMNIGFNLNLAVIVEGIENEKQLTTLLEISNQDIIGQGYLFSRPVPAVELEKILLRGEI